MKSPLTLIKDNSVLGPLFVDFTAPVSYHLMRAFEIYFASHIFFTALLFYLRNPGERHTILSIAILLVALVATLFRRYCRLGLLILLIYHLQVVIGLFPWTANHHFLEIYVLLFLVLFPSRIVNHNRKLVDGTSCHLIQFVILYSYFFSAFHKILQGFWLNGEFLGWSMLNLEDVRLPLHHVGQLILKAIVNLFNLPISDIPFDRSLEMGQAAILIPIWLVITLIIIHWVTILVEFATPILVVTYRNQKLGRYLLIGMTLMIGLPSLELPFMFAALGCDFLFFPKKPGRNYIILTALHALLPIAVLGIRLTGNLPS